MIGTETEQIYLSYALLSRVVATVTDSASNFAKLKMHQPVDSELDEENVSFTDLKE